jgi:hypothetical protein
MFGARLPKRWLEKDWASWIEIIYDLDGDFRVLEGLELEKDDVAIKVSVLQASYIKWLNMTTCR